MTKRPHTSEYTRNATSAPHPHQAPTFGEELERSTGFNEEGSVKYREEYYFLLINFILHSSLNL